MNGENIECPFCGSRTVLATVLTKLCFRSEHTVHTTGVDMSCELGDLLCDYACDPIISLSSFHCTSCEERWITSQYDLIKGEDGMFSFKKQEKNLKRKGRKK